MLRREPARDDWSRRQVPGTVRGVGQRRQTLASRFWAGSQFPNGPLTLHPVWTTLAAEGGLRRVEVVNPQQGDAYSRRNEPKHVCLRRPPRPPRPSQSEDSHEEARQSVAGGARDCDGLRHMGCCMAMRSSGCGWVGRGWPWNRGNMGSPGMRPTPGRMGLQSRLPQGP